MTPSSSHRGPAIAWLAVLLGTLLGTSLVAHAQTPRAVSMSTAQRELNDEGVRALGEGDYQTARLRLEAALSLGPNNLLYVNLGRTLALVGQCDEAVAAFDAVSSAPRIDSLPHTDILQALERYRDDLPGQCPGQVLLVCDPLDLEIRIDGDDWQPCPRTPISLPAGAHTVAVRQDADEPPIQHDLDVVGLQLTTLPLDLTAPADDLVATGGDTGDLLRTAGWVTAGTGAALLVSALVVELAALQPDADDLRAAADRGDQARVDALTDDIDTLQTTNIVLFSVGTVATLTGAGLLIAGYTLETPDPSPVSFGLGPTSARVRVVW